MAKRKIISHKGGRTANFHQRITPKHREMLREICEHQQKSMADWLESHIENDFTLLPNKALQPNGYRLDC